MIQILITSFVIVKFQSIGLTMFCFSDGLPTNTKWKPRERERHRETEREREKERLLSTRLMINLLGS